MTKRLKIDNLDNLQELQLEESTTLQGGASFVASADIKVEADAQIADIEIAGDDKLIAYPLPHPWPCKPFPWPPYPCDYPIKSEDIKGSDEISIYWPCPVIL